MKNLNLLSLEESQCQNNHNKNQNKLFLIFLKIPKLQSTLLDKEANDNIKSQNATYIQESNLQFLSVFLPPWHDFVSTLQQNSVIHINF